MLNTNIGALRVWHIPQVPGEPFHVEVSSQAEAAKLIAVLADYDLFQFKNRIKGDYANISGLERFEEDGGDGKPDWCEWCDDETGDDIHEWARQRGAADHMAAELTDERAAFEAKMTEQGYDISRDERTGGRDYARPATRAAWDGYRAALASQPPAQGAEPVAWEAPEGLGIVRFVSDRRYQLFSPKIRAYYKPYRCSQCTAPPHTAEVEKKAARYDWLRKHWFDFGVMMNVRTKLGSALSAINRAGDVETLDAAIDAALQSDQAQAGKGE